MRGHLLGTVAAFMAITLAALQPARADKAHDELRVVWTNEAPLIDVYFTTVPEAINISHQVYDRLVERDPVTFEYKPGLATAWRWIDPTTIEFDLRHGVKFHDGSDFDADDVVHTFTWMLDPANKVMYRSNIDFLASAEKIDPFKVRLHLKAPFPQAFEYISMPLAIYPRSYKGPEDLTRHPNGTGPYRVTKVDGTKGYTLERFDGYFEGGIKPKPAIQKVTIRVVPDAATEIAELLAGRADWVSQITSDQMAELKTQPKLQAFGSEVMRIGFILYDASGRSGADNPLTKLKVRQALNHGIDRDSLVTQLIGGTAKVINTPCNPLNFGCDATAAVPYDYDPTLAKKLLAEAGYPNGLNLALWTSTTRPLEWSEALQQNWRSIGVNVSVNRMPPQAVNEKLEAQGLPIYYTDWGGFRINDASAFVSIFFRGSPDDIARDPEVMALLKTGDTSPDIAARKEAYAKAIHRITDQALILPLNTFNINYAATKELNFQGYRDEIPRFFAYRWN
jgi:peptide/nickel transport system substrate-binding protein